MCKILSLSILFASKSAEITRNESFYLFLPFQIGKKLRSRAIYSNMLQNYLKFYRYCFPGGFYALKLKNLALTRDFSTVISLW